MEQEELAEYREQVRAGVYRRLKRLEAAETLLGEANEALKRLDDHSEFFDLINRITGFVAENR